MKKDKKVNDPTDSSEKRRSRLTIHRKLGLSLLLLVLLFLSVAAVTIATRYQNKAAEPLSANESLAANELAFIRTVYDAYLGKADTVEKVGTLMNEGIQAVKEKRYNTPEFYRPFCTQATALSLVKGESLSPDDPYLKYFVSNWDSEKFRSSFSNITSLVFSEPMVGFDCLIAINLLRNKIPMDALGGMLEDIKYAAQKIASASVDPVAHYQRYAIERGGLGDSMAEESQSWVDFFVAASKLLPDSGAGAISDTERNLWFANAKRLAQWSFSHCPWSGTYEQDGTQDPTKACSLMGEYWMVINHAMNPNPSYTLSLLTEISEVGMIYNQLGTSDASPSVFFNPTTVSNINNIATELKKWIDSKYLLTGSFNYIRPNGDSVTSFNYRDMTYTLDGENTHSSIPRDRIDAMNQYYIPNTDTLVSYVEKGNRLWNYTCTQGACTAGYQKNSLLDEWASRRIEPLADGSQPPLPESVDAVSQWYMPDKTTLKTYVVKGDRLWHYTCTQAGCRASYSIMFRDMWKSYANQDSAGWTTNPPPDRDVDAFAQFLVPGTNELKSVIIKGKNIWMYTCRFTGTGFTGCQAEKIPFNNLSALWKSMNKTNWASNPPPNDSVDTFYIYVSPDNTLKGYLTKGAAMWAFTCTDWNFRSCSSQYFKTLTDVFGGSIGFQIRWPRFPGSGIEQRKGIIEFGHNGTIQNSAYAGLYLVNPSENLDFYRNLQSVQIDNGRAAGIPYFPVDYDPAGGWNNVVFKGIKSGILWHAMVDGVVEPGSFDMNARINAHWWINMLSVKNHAMAYLALTPKKNMLGQFQPVSIPVTTTQTPTLTPTPTPRSTVPPWRKPPGRDR